MSKSNNDFKKVKKGDSIIFYKGRNEYTGVVIDTFSGFLSVYPHNLSKLDSKGKVIDTDHVVEASDFKCIKPKEKVQ
jgi:hypothetical protein